MKEIKLTQGQVALVDDEDYEYLMQWKWYANDWKSGYYAVRTQNKGKPSMIIMHRVILNAPQGMLVDHRDYNTLNNQKYNLRLCNASQNSCNKISRSKSGYLGVTFHKWSGKYFAAVRINGIRFYSKYVSTAEEAALLYNNLAIKYHGKFARLNIIKTSK